MSQYRKFYAVTAIRVGAYFEVPFRARKIAFGQYASAIMEDERMLIHYDNFAHIGNPLLLYGAAASQARATIASQFVEPGERFLLDIVCRAPGLNVVPAVLLDLWMEGKTRAKDQVQDAKLWSRLLSSKDGLARRPRFVAAKTRAHADRLNQTSFMVQNFCSYRRGDSVPLLASRD